MVEPVFRYEPLSYLLQTGLPELAMECWEESYDEIKGDSFSPDWRRYGNMEDTKDGGFIAMRVDERLAGYAVMKINPDIHQRQLRVALLHDVYITEKSRGYAIKFFRYLENFAMMLGAYRIDVAEIIGSDVGKFYKYMGMRPMEVIWSKHLGKMGNA